MAEMLRRRNSPQVPSGNTRQVDAACPDDEGAMRRCCSGTGGAGSQAKAPLRLILKGIGVPL